jgi:hypothetical protein
MWNGFVKVTIVWFPARPVLSCPRPVRKGSTWSARSAARTNDVEADGSGERLWEGDGVGHGSWRVGPGRSGRRGSACRHPDVRGLGPHVGDAQVGAPHLFRRLVGAAERCRGSILQRRCPGPPGAGVLGPRRSAPRHRGRSCSLGLVVIGVWVISAQRNPASSRAIAVTTTPLMFLRAPRARKRRHNRSWAVQDRARVSAGRSICRARRAVPMIGRCW